jgi:4-aminobutyrate aminotransferase-like enzyme/Ser/Thr protein kinase RdoA (MazF antagonist)
MNAFEALTRDRTAAPAVDEERAAALARELFGLEGEVRALDSYMDRNFLIGPADGERWVLKVANADEDEAALDLQQRAMEALARLEPRVTPVALRSRAGRVMESVELGGARHLVRAVTFLPGTLLAEAEHAVPATWRGLGATLARVDHALEPIDHPVAERPHRWNLAGAAWTVPGARRFAPERRRVVEAVQLQFLGRVLRRLGELPHGLLHNDANDRNVVVRDDAGGAVVSGLFDFGDMCRAPRVFELAIACAYAALDRDDPLEPMGALAAGYDEVAGLSEAELEALFPAVCMRLAVSVTVSAMDAELEPDNEYIRVSEAPAWRALEHFAALEPHAAEDALRAACGRERRAPSVDREHILELRERHVGPSLSLSYRRPLVVVRGRGTYLFDETGRAHLDCVNNVCHVGHCHPRVVAAAAEQMAELNTNTRYLHPHLARYAERLTGLFPEPLSICYLVNSGSEANELALRLARTYTGRRELAVVEGGYHGHTSALIDLSHYKHAGPGGAGTPDWVHTVPCPDTYRGPHRGADAAALYTADARRALEGRELAAFLAEPLIGCGGQIVPPDGWLRGVFESARSAGAVCIADEVQVGFGRVGTHWWAFEQQGAVPDIVTLGKPIGNGHPMGAVVTTPEIARAFDNGMEFFATFGGNPVSCAVGLAVLDVLEEEQLQGNAARVGERLLAGFRELAQRHECIGDVRGSGLYLGVELVRDRETREPAPELLAGAVERCREAGVLLSTDGPDHDVLKVKPPLAFGQPEAELLLSVFDSALSESG